MIRFIVLAALALGCTRQSAPQPPAPAQTTHPDKPATIEPSTDQPDVGSVTGPAASGVQTPAQEASFPFELDKAAVAKHVVYVDNLRYRFQYGPRTAHDDIVFQNDKAEITIKGLRVGIESDLVLEIFEKDTLRLKGEAKGLKLKSGPNRVPLALRPVDGTDTGGIDINLGLDDSDNEESASASIHIQIPENGSDGNNDDTLSDTNSLGGHGAEPGIPDNNRLEEETSPEQDTTTFARDLKPIFERHCAECHHSGGQVPNLTVAPVDSLSKVVSHIENRTMPPAPRDGIPPSDLAKIKAWAASLP